MDLSQSTTLNHSSISNSGAKTVLNLLALATILAGTLFKRMHWHGADIILLASTAALLATLIFTYKDLEIATKNGLVGRILTALLFFLIISAAFSRFHWNGAGSLVAIAAVLSVLLAFFLILTRNEFRLPKQFAITILLYLIYVMGAISFLSIKNQAVLDQAVQNQ